MPATEAELQAYAERFVALLERSKALEAMHARICVLMDAARLEPELEYERRTRG